MDIEGRAEVGNVIAAAGHAAFMMAVIAGAPPAVQAYRDRALTPQPGDLVLELTSYQLRDRTGEGHEALGTFVRREGDSWIVENFARGVEERWANCEFVAIPRTAAEAALWRRG